MTHLCYIYIENYKKLRQVGIVIYPHYQYNLNNGLEQNVMIFVCLRSNLRKTKDALGKKVLTILSL